MSHRHRLILVLALLVAATGLTAGARADSPPDYGRAFEPHPRSRPVYGISEPTDDNGQRTFVEAPNENGTTTKLFLEVWLPVARAGGPVPPPRVPTVLEVDPYYDTGKPGYYSSQQRDELVSRGYAFAMTRVRGVGDSEGCMDLRGDREAQDSGAVLDWIAHQAPWSDGAIGLYGISYSGGTALSAATRGRPDLVKAIAIVAPYASVYEYTHVDGVKYTASQEYYGTQYPAPGPEWAAGEDPVAHAVDRSSCYADHVAGAAEPTGALTEYYRRRDDRASLANLRAATLLAHGHADWNVLPIVEAGLFDQIPKGVPKAGVFGMFGHEMPDVREFLDPALARADWIDMEVAWFDRYLKGLGSGVESWPVAQVQGNDGQWRAESDWPTTGGPIGQLALGGGGTLGATKPDGFPTSYVEGAVEVKTQAAADDGYVLAPGTFATFETAPLPDRLELTGQPVLDLWLTLDRPDAHVAVRLETLGPDGELLGSRGHGPLSAIYDTSASFGFRSAQHLDPLVDGRFWQSEAKLPPVLTPVRVPVRLQPADLVVPKGGRLRVVVAGSLVARNGVEGDVDAPSVIEDPSEPSGAGTVVRILHDRAHPSALRFRMPASHPELLDVREVDELEGPLGEHPAHQVVSDGGGMATAPVWGVRPYWPSL